MRREDEEDEGEGASEDVGGVELDEGSERPSEEVPLACLQIFCSECD